MNTRVGDTGQVLQVPAAAVGDSALLLEEPSRAGTWPGSYPQRRGLADLFDDDLVFVQLASFGILVHMVCTRRGCS